MIKRALLILGIVAFAFCYVPPPAPSSAQFSGQAQWARSVSSGSANAQTVALANYNLNVGVPITFTVGGGLSNTGPTNLNINATGVVQIRRQTNVGSFELVGGEFVAGNQATVVYDGSVYKLVGQIYQVGVSVNQRGTTADPGWQIEDGSCFSSTAATYAALFARIGAVYGNCGASTFRVPDARGTMDAALDNQGSNGSVGKITAAGCGNVFTAIPALCGSQTSSLTSVNQFPPYVPAGAVTQVTATGIVSAPAITIGGAGPGVLNNQGVGGGANVTGGGATYNIGAVTAVLASAPLFTGTNSGTGLFTGSAVGTSSPFPVLNPVFGTIRAIKL